MPETLNGDPHIAQHASTWSEVRARSEAAEIAVSIASGAIGSSYRTYAVEHLNP